MLGSFGYFAPSFYVGIRPCIHTHLSKILAFIIIRINGPNIYLTVFTNVKASSVYISCENEFAAIRAMPFYLVNGPRMIARKVSEITPISNIANG